MRVVHLDTGRDWRGGQSQVLLLLEGLRARGHDVLLLAPEAPLLTRARAAGLATRSLAARGEWDLASAWSAGGGARRFAADLIHAHTARAHTLGIVAAARARVPLVVSRRVTLPVGAHPLSGLKYRRAARYLCVSRGVLESMRRSGVAPERLALVESGIVLGPTPPTDVDLRERIGASLNDDVIVTVAALTREKGYDVLLKAASRVVRERPATHFAWIGEGRLRGALERERARLGLGARVHLIGFRDDARALIAQATVFVLASAHEGIGNAVLEAQWAGVPVVATAVGGIPEIVEDRVTGRLVRAGVADALATALLETLDDPVGRAAWIEPARRSARAHDADRMVTRTIEEYGRVLANPNPRAALAPVSAAERQD